MPAAASSPSTTATVIAPDGIAIHTFATPAGAFAGVAEGRLPRGAYGVHRHLSLEQYTYVVSGRVTAITNGVATPLAAGDLLLTLPGESLQFVNEGAEPARMLFICAPPYPPDDADTRTLGTHEPMAAEEMPAAIGRMEAIRAAFNEVIDARVAALRTHGPW